MPKFETTSTSVYQYTDKMVHDPVRPDGPNHDEWRLVAAVSHGPLIIFYWEREVTS